MTVREIAERMEEGSLTGHEVADARSIVSAHLFRLNEEYGRLSSLAALWMTAHRENYKSQAECERAWEATENGLTMIEKKYAIRGLEALSEGLATLWFLNQREYKEA